MSGYREHSYDPNAYEPTAGPARPFNWVQWTGVGFGTVGILLFLFYAAGRLGWAPELVDTPTPSTGLTLIGVVLINSRREPSTDIAPELAAARKRWLIIVTFVCVVVLGAATVLAFLGV